MENGGGFLSTVTTSPGCMSGRETLEGAAHNMEEAIFVRIAVAK
jgi:predicted RNase H-like HicB family nuclease